jgi:hypothetical protein
MQALSLAQSAGEVARVIADLGGAPAGARFANIALLDGGSEPPAARLFHAPSLVEDVARGYPVIPVDESTPLGTVLRSGGRAGRASRPMAAAWPVPASALCARRWNDYLAAEAVFLAGVSSLPGSIGAVALMTSSVNLRWLASSCSAKL